MELVKDRWYKTFNTILIVIGVLFAALTLTTQLIKNLPLPPFLLHLPIAVGVMSIILITYASATFSLSKRYGLGTINFISVLLSVLLALLIVHTQGDFLSLYIPVWLLVTFLAGVVGFYINIGVVFISLMYFVINISPHGASLREYVFGMGFVLLTAITSCVSYYVWHKAYIGPDDRHLKELTTVINSKEKQSETLLNAVPDAIVVTNKDNKISFFNPAASFLTGWTTTDAIDIDPNTIFTFVDNKSVAIADDANPFIKANKEQQIIRDTLRLKKRDGTERFVSLIVAPITIPESAVTVGSVSILRDISDEHHQEEQRAEFISTASHEMRTPVAAIEGYIALAMNENVCRIDAKAHGFLEKAHASTQHLGKLFQDLLTSAKAEDGRLVNHPQVVEMSSYLDQISDSLKFVAQKKGLAVEFTIGTSTAEENRIHGGKVIKPLYYVYVDPDRLREVITNLFDNAVKYTEAGKIMIALTGNDVVVQFFIQDTGHGIPTEDVPHLFQKFYRVDSSAIRTIGGTGLGLFICKKIIEIYNGRIWVESTLNKGSTFYINLPRLNSQKATELLKQESNNLSIS
ncbi:MAG: hypothetical protein NVSMB46_07800 [Candidatus Saccharimonadales bacterium]